MFKIKTVVIGAGVVGLAVARALAQRGREVVVLEKESGIGQGVSSRNSEVIHAGLYYETGSLKARFCVAGRRAMYEYSAERGIPHARCGKLVVATTPNEDGFLQSLMARAHANGVEDVELVGKKRLQALEPDLAASSALLSLTTGIVDGHALMVAYQGDAERAGATVSFRTPVIGGAICGDRIQLRTGGIEPAEIEAELVVNCASLNAWEISENLHGLDLKTVPPRYLAKGTYFSLGGRAPFRHLIYPVPGQGGLGIHLTFDLGGQARFGPDVEWIDRIDYGVDPERGRVFYDAIRRYWPDLQDGALLPAYSGIRPKTVAKGEKAADFIIQGPGETGHRGYIALYGIESPGLTSSLAIADHVAALAGG